ncbi:MULTISPECIES: pentapeptide repeat-containing protein [unclassified Synechococcus]|uniref:pentapeptide repeat-containing protein n=1 Tax=unclassified Synechococcus TaxID=2626047 RepID=UPI0021A3497B|nr:MULTISPECIES: pentapeptide repeat-containing protein [unclassified Synechococcus]MCT0211966.1 pentapeptide repeat-containing protein [Synechococcus sp. CS-1326]MCT0232378.1 pentapeptide repeat-containing protein [Synechococcus sp. CS-1327]
MTLTSLQVAIDAVPFWWRALTRPARWLLGLQFVLFIPYLLEMPSREASAYVVESLNLLQFLVVWCAWCEQLFSLRRCFQATETQHPSLWRRLTLDLYGGFLFMAVLSLLVTVHPLLGIGAMFLLFTSVEALDVNLGNRSIAGALVGGMGRSYRLISSEPWRFLARLLTPGLVLYAGGSLVVGLRQWATELPPPWLKILGLLLAGLALLLWLGFFALAQLRIQVRSMAIDVDDLLIAEDDANHATLNDSPLDPESLSSLRLLAGRIGAMSGWAATAISVAMGLWLVYQLGRNGLLNTAALVEAFQGMVAFVTSTVQASVDLLLKLGFLTVVVGAVACGVWLLVRLGHRSPLSLRKGLDKAVRNAIGGARDFLAKDLGLSSSTLGIGTLLTALGTVAVQTYASVQDGQLQQQKDQQSQEQNHKAEQEVKQQLNGRMDGLEIALKAKVETFVLDAKKDNQDQRVQMASDLRDVLPQLRRPDGGADGERKGNILRHLYESGLLLPNDQKPSEHKKSNDRQTECAKELDKYQDFANLGGKSQRDAESIISTELKSCLPGVYLGSMNFSGANLNGAFLERSFLPFLNLNSANLRGAKLQGANLRHAQMQDTDLRGADLRGADLRGAVVVGSDLTDVQLDCKTQMDGLVAFYAHFPPENRNALPDPGKCGKDIPLKKPQVISWDPLKYTRPLTSDEEKDRARWSFCPLDPVQELIQDQDHFQAGSRCSNRRFEGGVYGVNSVSLLKSDPLNRNYTIFWSGGEFINTHFELLTLQNVDLVGATLENANFKNVRLKNVDFTGANLQGATFSDSTLEDVNFTGANLRKVSFERVRARNVHLQGIVVDNFLNLGSYNESLQREGAFKSNGFERHVQDELATFRQDFLAPILFGPLTLRPLHLLYWMLPNALPQHFAIHPGTAP